MTQIDTIVGWSLMGWSLNPRLLFSLDFRDLRRVPPEGRSVPRARMFFHDPELVDFASISRDVMDGIEVRDVVLAAPGEEAVECTIHTSRGAIRVLARGQSLLSG